VQFLTPLVGVFFCLSPFVHVSFGASSLRNFSWLPFRKEFLVEKEKNIFPKGESQKKRLILAGFCLSVIAAAALIGRSNCENNQYKLQDDFQPMPVGAFIMPDQTSTNLQERLLVEQEKPSATPSPAEAPTPTSVLGDDKERIQATGGTIIPTQKPTEPQPSILMQELQPGEERTIIPTEVVSNEPQADTSIKSTNGEIVTGPATYYGVDDGYGLENSLGCTGESFDPYDSTTAARPWSSPFKCGDRVEVCDNDSCIEVVIKDTCPGCDNLGIVIDLSYGAMQKLSPGTGKTWVTLKKLE